MRNPRPFPDDLHTIFKQLDPQTFQQFAQAQQHWTALQRMAELETHIDLLQEELTENDMQLKWLQPSAVALAAIARFQAYGVDDLDLLDTMLERGETWLDQTLQLLEQCEHLGLIGDSYTAWCEHALEGAYDWIASMHSNGEDAELTTANTMEEIQQNGHQELFIEITEEMLIRRLMSEDDTEKLVAILPTHANGEEEAVALASLAAPDTIEAQDAAAPIDAPSTDELAETHTQPVTEMLVPAESVAASAEPAAALDSAQEQATSSDAPALAEMLAAPEAAIEVIEAAAVPAPLDMSAEALDTPEALVAADIPVEASSTSEVLASPDSFAEALATPETLVPLDILTEVADNAEIPVVVDSSAETLDTPDALASLNTIIAPSDVPEVVTISDTGAEASEVPVETSNAPEILETLETPDKKPDALEAADEPLEETSQVDAGGISEEASPSWEEHEAAVETPENDLFNEYIETADDPLSDATYAEDDQRFDAASTHVEAVSEEQHDPFTVDGTVTYLPAGDAGVQAAPNTSIDKPRRRFFLWRLLARIFRRPAKKTS